MRPWLSALAWMLLALMVDIGVASAQQSGRVYRIGWLWIGRPDLVPQPIEKWTGGGAAFRDALRDGGFVVGKNLIFDARHAHGDVTRLAAEAASLAAANVDVLVTIGTPPTFAAMQATKGIPIVFHSVGDPVDKGIVASHARPGGIVTGVAVQTTEAKLWQLLRETSPTTRRGAVVSYASNRVPEDREAALQAKNIARRQAYAAAVGLEYIRTPVNSLDEAESTFAKLAGDGNAGIIILSDSTLSLWRTPIMGMALKHRLPSSCPQLREWAEAGCLVTYAEDVDATNRRVASQLVKVLRGTSPSDIPVEEPTNFKLIYNTKTAKALGLTMPPSLLADEVID